MKKIQVLGRGCYKCNKLIENTEKAIKELGLECEIEKVGDIREIMKFGVLTIPALIIDGDVKNTGMVPTVEEIKNFLI